MVSITAGPVGSGGAENDVGPGSGHTQLAGTSTSAGVVVVLAQADTGTKFLVGATVSMQQVKV